MPTASWAATNSRSNRSISASRRPGLHVYCLSSTTGAQFVPAAARVRTASYMAHPPHLVRRCVRGAPSTRGGAEDAQITRCGAPSGARRSQLDGLEVVHELVAARLPPRRHL